MLSLGYSVYTGYTVLYIVHFVFVFQPPAPLLKVINTNRMSDTGTESTDNKAKKSTGRRKNKKADPSKINIPNEDDSTQVDLPWVFCTWGFRTK